jgi:RND superfamily putative drug exporter
MALRAVVRNIYGARLMTALARLVLGHKRAIVLLWIALTLIGAYSANAVSSRWLEQFSIPGYSAYEANQRALKTFGTGENAPLVAVFHSEGDVTKAPGSSRRSRPRRGRTRARASAPTSPPAATLTSHATATRRSPSSIRPATRASTGRSRSARLGRPEAGDAARRDLLSDGRDALQEAASGGDSNGPSVFSRP